jgi:cell division protein FtsL
MGLAGEAEVMDLKYKIAETEKRLKSLDKEVKDYLESNYMKFTGLLQENHLILRAKDLVNDINQLENRINNRVSR